MLQLASTLESCSPVSVQTTPGIGCAPGSCRGCWRNRWVGCSVSTGAAACLANITSYRKGIPHRTAAISGDWSSQSLEQGPAVTDISDPYALVGAGADRFQMHQH